MDGSNGQETTKGDDSGEEEEEESDENDSDSDESSDDSDNDEDGIIGGQSSENDARDLIESFLDLKDPQINWKMIEFLSYSQMFW